MISDYKAKSALEAYKKAWDAIAITWDDTSLAQHLTAATLHDYHDGTFTIAVPTQYVANIFSRNAERFIVQRSLELYMPEGMTIAVRFIAASEATPS